MSTTNNNPFNFSEEQSSSTSSRRLDLTPKLVDLSSRRASDLIMKASKDETLKAMANAALDSGSATDLMNLINTVYDSETIKADSAFLDGQPDDIYDRLLESRRSDRSKAKEKGLRTKLEVCIKWIGSMYAEMLVRTAWDKPYNANAVEVDYSSADKLTITKKIKSLQSKLSRAKQSKLSTPEDIQAIEDEIARLNGLRGTKVNGTVSVKNLSTEQIRTAVEQIDQSKLNDEERARLAELMAKLG